MTVSTASTSYCIGRARELAALNDAALCEQFGDDGKEYVRAFGCAQQILADLAAIVERLTGE